MRDIFKLTLVLATALIFAVFPTACNTTAVCSVETVGSNVIVAALASPLLLNCNSIGYATLQANAQSILDKYGACGQSAMKGQFKGAVASAVCPAVEASLNALVASAVPTGCTPVVSAPVQAIEGVALAACISLPF